MNMTVLGGRLTKDPEMRRAGDMVIADISIATDKYSKGERSADYHNCTAFGKTAEFIEKFFHKGDFIIVNGSNTSGSYQGKDGKTVYTYKVTVNSVEFGGGKSSGGETTQAKTAPKSTGKKREAFMNVPEDDEEGLPFA